METNVVDKKQFQKEQDQLLKTILDLRFFNPWKGLVAYNNETSLQNDSELEIYITNKCNQNCSYCYLHKYNELYPEEYNNSETILHNLQLLYDYLVVNNYHIPKVDFFSGEIWHTQLGIDILEITFQYILNGLRVDQFCIPSNGTFVSDDEYFQKIQFYIMKFLSVGTQLCFSFSIDGKIIDNIYRPHNDGTLYTDEFYDKLFTFAKMNNFYFHPMVSADNIKYWIENYDWWVEQHKYYELDIQNIMMLEVRNDNWDDESLKQYCDFLRYTADYYLTNSCNNDPTIMARVVGNVRVDETLPKAASYAPWAIPLNDTFFGCSIGQQLTVRLGDLAICPCHRTAYDKYLYGYFVVEDDRIVDIKAQNPYMAIKVLMTNTQSSYPICNKCIYNRSCLKGCLGAQIEAQKDPFFPIPGICKFFKNKYDFLIQYYREKGIMDYLKTIKTCEINTFNTQYILSLNSLYEEENGNGLGTRK